MEHSLKKVGLGTFQLKLIAIVAMLMDHLAFAFLPAGTVSYFVLRFFGRLTGPLMFFCAAQGYRHTRNLKRYLLRLFLFAAVSYVPFVLFSAQGNFSALNFGSFGVIHTIFLGVLGLHVRHTVEKSALKVLLLALLLVLSLPGDWGGIGFVMILTFDFFYEDLPGQKVGYLLIVLFGGDVLWFLTQPLSELLATGHWPYTLPDFLSYVLYSGINLGLFLPLLCISRYNGKPGTDKSWTKWLFYVFYPAHLLLIAILRFWAARSGWM